MIVGSAVRRVLASVGEIRRRGFGSISVIGSGSDERWAKAKMTAPRARVAMIQTMDFFDMRDSCLAIVALLWVLG